MQPKVLSACACMSTDAMLDDSDVGGEARGLRRCAAETDGSRSRLCHGWARLRRTEPFGKRQEQRSADGFGHCGMTLKLSGSGKIAIQFPAYMQHMTKVLTIALV